VWKLADPRITNENAVVITEEASWWFVGKQEVSKHLTIAVTDRAVSTPEYREC
jgi:hypothetical protein